MDLRLEQVNSRIKLLINLTNKQSYTRVMKWILLALIIGFAGEIKAQEPLFIVEISGRILDGSTAKPLPKVDVFLSGTTKSSQTDENGFFKIENILTGSYTMVVSKTGFEVYQSPIRITESLEGTIQIPLKQALQQASDILDSQLNPESWRPNLNQFKTYLFGPTPNASKCNILNPEVLYFEANPEIEELRASPKAPLRIENLALGYRIDLYIQEFLVQNGLLVRFQHLSKFEVIPPKDSRQEKEWQKNRLRAYHGSLPHFITSLISGTLEQEGYLISQVFRMFRDEREQTFNQIPGESILTSGDFPHEKKLSFSEYIKIIYTEEDQEIDYYRDEFARTTAGRASLGQKSWIRMNTPSVIIDVQGSMEIPNALSNYGYMEWEKFAEVLPTDYHSPQVLLQKVTSQTTEKTVSRGLDARVAIPEQNLFHFEGVSLGLGQFQPLNEKIRTNFGSLPMIHLNFYGEYSRFYGLITLSYGEKQSIRNTVFVKDYNILSIKYYSNLSLKTYNLTVDFLYQINRRGRLRFLVGPGITAASMIIVGNEMKGLAGGRLYGDEILDDEIAGGIGWEGVLGIHFLFKRLIAQFYIKYQSKVFMAHGYFEYDPIEDADVPRYRHLFDNRALQFTFSMGLFR